MVQPDGDLFVVPSEVNAGLGAGSDLLRRKRCGVDGGGLMRVHDLREAVVVLFGFALCLSEVAGGDSHDRQERGRKNGTVIGGG